MPKGTTKKSSSADTSADTTTPIVLTAPLDSAEPASPARSPPITKERSKSGRSSRDPTDKKVKSRRRPKKKAKKAASPADSPSRAADDEVLVPDVVAEEEEPEEFHSDDKSDSSSNSTKRRLFDPELDSSGSSKISAQLTQITDLLHAHAKQIAALNSAATPPTPYDIGGNLSRLGNATPHSSGIPIINTGNVATPAQTPIAPMMAQQRTLGNPIESWTPPNCVLLNRVGRTPANEIDDIAAKAYTKMKLPPLGNHYKNLELENFLVSLDRKRWCGWRKPGNTYDNIAYNDAVSADIPDAIRKFVVGAQDICLPWDTFLGRMYNHFYQPNETLQARNSLQNVQQRQTQSVLSYAHYFRQLAKTANMTDEIDLGRLFYRSLLDANRSSEARVAPEGMTLDKAIIEAEQTERTRLYHESNTPSRGNKLAYMDKREDSKPRPSRADSSDKKTPPPKRPESGVRPLGTPDGNFYYYKKNGTRRAHPDIVKFRVEQGLCKACGGNAHETDKCTSAKRPIAAKYLKEWPADKPIPKKTIAKVFENSGTDSQLIAFDVFQRESSQPYRDYVLIDSGATLSYVDPDAVATYNFKMRKLQKPYTPYGVDGQPLGEVKKQALVRFGFGDHYETFPFDVLPMGGMKFVLGRNWMEVHDPLLRLSNNFYPKFDQPGCKEHTINNSLAALNASGMPERIAPVYKELRSMTEVNRNIFGPIVYSDRATPLDTLVISTMETLAPFVLSETPPSPPPAVCVTYPPMVNHTPPSTWTPPAEPSMPQPPPKAKAPGKKSDKSSQDKKFTFSIIRNKDFSKRVLVIRHESTVIRVVRDIAYGHSADDTYFLAFVSPIVPPSASKPKDEKAGDPETVKLPPEYRRYAAAFSDGITSLPDRGPHDMPIDLVDGKHPKLGPLYNMSEQEQIFFILSQTGVSAMRPENGFPPTQVLF